MMKQPSKSVDKSKPARKASNKVAKAVTVMGKRVAVGELSAKAASAALREARKRFHDESPGDQRIACTIAGVGMYVPEKVMTSEYIEKEVGFEEKFNMPPGTIERITGVRERRYSNGHQVSSDMACEASKMALERAGVTPEELDVVIFASASHDIAEPATANILQAKLGAVNAHCLDAKNACNSFLNGIDIMDAFMKTGRCRLGLVAAGEVLSKFVNWDIKTVEELELGFSAFTLGDGGGAVVFKAEEDVGRGVRKTRFTSDGRAWELATIMGGGTLCPFDLSRNYFVSRSADMNRLAIRHIPPFVKAMMSGNGWALGDLDLVIPHQVTRSITERLMKIVGLPLKKAMITVNKYGNTAAASVPMALADAVEEGRAKAGNKVMLVGGASGFSVGVVTVVL